MLHCSSNELISLDVSGCSDLRILEVPANQLTELDISSNLLLMSLYCEGNQLASLDLTNNTMLTDIQCAYNKLTMLDVSGINQLEYLSCYGNYIPSVDHVVGWQKHFTEPGSEYDNLPFRFYPQNIEPDGGYTITVGDETPGGAGMQRAITVDCAEGLNLRHAAIVLCEIISRAVVETGTRCLRILESLSFFVFCIRSF